eukprot:tig00000157_g9701.t1
MEGRVLGALLALLAALRSASATVVPTKEESAAGLCAQHISCSACVYQWDGFGTCQWCPGQGCLWSGNSVNCGGLWVYAERNCLASQLDTTIQQVKRFSQSTSAQCGGGCVAGVSVAAVVGFIALWGLVKWIRSKLRRRKFQHLMNPRPTTVRFQNATARVLSGAGAGFPLRL